MKQRIILTGVLLGGWLLTNVLPYPMATAQESNKNPTKSTQQHLALIQNATANLKPANPSPIPPMPPGKPGPLPEKENIVQLSEQNWQAEVLQSKKPVLVVFFASYAPAALKQKEELEGLRERYAGRLKFGLLDCEKNAQACGKLKLQAIPTLRLYDLGNMVGQLKKFTKEEAMVRWIKETFKKDS